MAAGDIPSTPTTALRRRLGVTLLTLYGVGITIGAGIYVLIGAVAGHAGVFAPWSFLLAAIVMAFTVGSYAELATRYPVSAAEATYVRVAFGSRALSTLTGLVTIVIGVVSSSAVALGAAGYIREFLDLPAELIVVAVVLAVGAFAAWGILESVLLASLFTLVEVGGLVVIIVAAVPADVPIAETIVRLPPPEAATLSGIAFASLLAFFAFVGFEDLANAVEEAKVPHRDVPRAMAATLVIATLLYIAIAVIAVSAVAPQELASSSSPLSLVFNAVAGTDPAIISAIAIAATLNTILAQVTMAARVLYGMAREGEMPRLLGRVDPRTSTPLIATALVVAVVIVLALYVSFEWLAESTSLATLVVFALVNLALLRVRRLGLPAAGPHVTVPILFPIAGLITCLAMIATAFIS